tara:strand:- start:608 stop:745 length:138 start_codon:yes stop_codon:yes gene_type:complete
MVRENILVIKKHIKVVLILAIFGAGAVYAFPYAEKWYKDIQNDKK